MRSFAVDYDAIFVINPDNNEKIANEYFISNINNRFENGSEITICISKGKEFKEEIEKELHDFGIKYNFIKFDEPDVGLRLGYRVQNVDDWRPYIECQDIIYGKWGKIYRLNNSDKMEINRIVLQKNYKIDKVVDCYTVITVIRGRGNCIVNGERLPFCENGSTIILNQGDSLLLECDRGLIVIECKYYGEEVDSKDIKHLRLKKQVYKKNHNEDFAETRFYMREQDEVERID